MADVRDADAPKEAPAAWSRSPSAWLAPSSRGRFTAPSSHRTGLVGPTSGSSGRPVRWPLHRIRAPAYTRSYPEASRGCLGALAMDSGWRRFHSPSSETSPSFAKYALLSARSTAGR